MRHIKKFNVPKNVMLFKFSDIPNEMGDHIFDLAINLIGDGSLDYSAFRYRVGSFSDEYNRAHKSEKDRYNIKEVELDQKIVNWFSENGVKPGDVIYIER